MLKHPRPILRRRKRSSSAPKTRQLIDAKSARDARRRVGRMAAATAAHEPLQ